MKEETFISVSIIIFFVILGSILTYVYWKDYNSQMTNFKIIKDKCLSEGYEVYDYGIMGVICYEYKNGLRIRHDYIMKDNKVYEVKQ